MHYPREFIGKLSAWICFALGIINIALGCLGLVAHSSFRQYALNFLAGAFSLVIGMSIKDLHES
jgi:hypothetical protein